MKAMSIFPSEGPDARMKRLPLSEVHPGDIVARPVVMANGVVLVQSGTTLSGELLARLERLGVDAVAVEGTSADGPPLEEQLQALERRFAGHEQNTLMMQLKTVVADRLLRGADERRDG